MFFNFNFIVLYFRQLMFKIFAHDAHSTWRVSQQKLKDGVPNLCWSVVNNDPKSVPGQNVIFNFFIIAGQDLNSVAQFTGDLTMFK